MITRPFLTTVVLAATTLSCGYHVGGKSDLVPKSIQTISIPAFSSVSTRYQLADLLPNQIAREFIARTRFRVVKNASEADAVLNGNITSVQAYPVVSDPTSGKATTVQIIVTMNIKLLERTTGRVLYSRPSFIVKGQYEIAVDPHQTFDESGPAFTRVSQDAARDIVSGVVENF